MVHGRFEKLRLEDLAMGPEIFRVRPRCCGVLVKLSCDRRITVQIDRFASLNYREGLIGPVKYLGTEPNHDRFQTGSDLDRFDSREKDLGSGLCLVCFPIPSNLLE